MCVRGRFLGLEDSLLWLALWESAREKEAGRGVIMILSGTNGLFLWLVFPLGAILRWQPSELLNGPMAGPSPFKIFLYDFFSLMIFSIEVI
jgi:hypothetical protein